MKKFNEYCRQINEMKLGQPVRQFAQELHKEAEELARTLDAYTNAGKWELTPEELEKAKQQSANIRQKLDSIDQAIKWGSQPVNWAN